MWLLQGWDLHRVRSPGCWLLWGCKDREERKPPLSGRAVRAALPLLLDQETEVCGDGSCLGDGRERLEDTPEK